MNDVCPVCEKPRQQWGGDPQQVILDDHAIDFCGKGCRNQWVNLRLERAATLEQWAFAAESDDVAAAGARAQLLLENLTARMERALHLAETAIAEAEASHARTFEGEPFLAMVPAQSVLDILQPRKATP